MLPATTTRVEEHTRKPINREILDQTKRNIEHVAAHGPEAIRHRLQELEHEWDIERTLEANAASLALLGVGLGAFVDRRWLALPAGVAAFLLQHALQGWCPPVPIFRRLGIRTAREIEIERQVLKVLKGDYRHAAHSADQEHPDIDRLVQMADGNRGT